MDRGRAACFDEGEAMGQPELGVDLLGDSNIELRVADLSAARARPAVSRACAAYDARLATADVDARVPAFEACVRLATVASVGPWSYARLMETTRLLAASEIGISWASAELRLFPVDFVVPPAVARMTRIDRTSLDALVARDPRELAKAIARVEASLPQAPAAAGAGPGRTRA